MPNPLAHFAINADDVERAKSFYESVFGWTFAAWGPPGFYMIFPNGDQAERPHGSLQQRSEPLDGTGMRGFECSFAVQDLAAINAAIESNGGAFVMRDIEIPTVGTMTQFHDTEGNLVTAMQYA